MISALRSASRRMRTGEEDYEIAEAHGCEFFTVDELREEDIA